MQRSSRESKPIPSGLRLRLQERMSKLTQAEKRLAEHLLDSEAVAFSTASRLAQRAGVSESTVTRLCHKLGFENYAQLQNSTRREVANHLSAHADEKLSMAGQEVTPETFLAAVVAQDRLNVQRTLEDSRPEEFLAVAKLLWKARRVEVVGSRASAGLAMFLVYALGLVLPDVRFYGGIPGDEINHGLDLTADDILLAVAYTRCSQRTLVALELAKHRGATVATLTDAITNPAVALSDHVFMAGRDSSMFLPSYTGGLAWAHALVTAVDLVHPGRAVERLRMVEELMQRFPVHAPADT